MKFDNIEQLKEFIKWAKNQGLATMELDGVSFSFSDLRIIHEGPTADTPPNEHSTPSFKPDSKTWVDTETPEDDEDLLFHSAVHN